MSKQNDNDEQNRYITYCRNGCGKRIYFDDRIRSKSGKLIPQEDPEDISHECPKRINSYKKIIVRASGLQDDTQKNQRKDGDNFESPERRNSFLKHISEMIEYDNKQQEQILINQNQIKNQQKELMQLLLELVKRWS